MVDGSPSWRRRCRAGHPGSGYRAPVAAPHRLRSWSLRLLVALLVLVLVAVIGLVVWSRIGVMEAEEGPLRGVLQDPEIDVAETSSAMVLNPAGADSTPLGMIFYPGAKVEADAYAARLAPLVTEHGMTVLIVKPWLRLALLDRRSLETFTEEAPDVGSWMVGGHSLGGVRACQLAPGADALILFGSYCSNDLSDSGLPVLSLAGSEDGLSTPTKIADAREKLPEEAVMVEIDGASHASFGDYGRQSGDGTPLISDAAMDLAVTEAADEFVDDQNLDSH